MSLFTTRAAKIAEKPIRVYKCLIDKVDFYKTPVRNVIVRIGDTLYARRNEEPEYKDGILEIEGEGVHAFISPDYIKYSLLYDEVVSVWEIPAGTIYWEGDTCGCVGEIAATEMKFIRVIKRKKNY